MEGISKHLLKTFKNVSCFSPQDLYIYLPPEKRETVEHKSFTDETDTDLSDDASEPSSPLQMTSELDIFHSNTEDGGLLSSGPTLPTIEVIETDPWIKCKSLPLCGFTN